MVPVLALVAVALAAPARAESLDDDIYRWTDHAGRLHYSNTRVGPASDDIGGAVEGVSPEGSGEATGEVTASQVPSTPEDTAFANSASLRRNALERDLRTTERRLREVDEELAGIARDRAAPPSGPPLPNQGFQLAAEREQLAKRANSLRGDYQKLREEVTTRLGGTPVWWIDLRDRR
jgi:hypothetical protein